MNVPHSPASSPPPQTLAGRRFLITGASRGIGRATAIRLAEHGGDVAINFLQSVDAAKQVARQIDAMGRRVVLVRADVSNPDDVTAMVETAAETLDGLDGIISNAAAGGFRPLGETSIVNLEATLRCNALPVVGLANAAMPYLSSGEHHGKVVAVSSHGSRWSVPNYGAIGASKATLESLMRHLALEYGDRGVNFNVVLSGMIATDAVATMPGMRDTLAASQSRMMTGDRPLTENDVAGVIAFLCSPDSDLIQAQTVVVDGGVSVRV